jgi:hypothetical protein
MALAMMVFCVEFSTGGEVPDAIDGAAVLVGNGTFSGVWSVEGGTGNWLD